MKKIIVTGANGLLGRMICHKLLKKNFSIIGIIREKIKNPLENVDYIVADLSQSNFIKLLPKKADYIFHLSQSKNFRNFPKYASDIFSVNVNSTALLLDYAMISGVTKFLYASSGGVYGKGQKPFTENSPLVPLNKLGYYLGSKACGEILSQSYSKEFFITVIRPFFIYGQNQNKTMLLPRLMNSIEKELPINLEGKNGIRINPIHVDDACEGVIETLNHDGSYIYNIAGPNVYSLREISEKMGTFLGKNPNFNIINKTPNSLIGDISLMEEKLHSPKKILLEYLKDIYCSIEKKSK